MDASATSETTPIRRNILITAVMITISVSLCTLGFTPSAQPLDSIAVIWPGTLLHSVSTILFGGWGVLATVLAAVIADIINVGTLHATLGYIVPDFLQAIIPAAYYRHVIKKYGWGKEVLSFGPFLLYAVILSNVVGAITGPLILHAWSESNLWHAMLRWLIANIPIAVLLGWPLLRYLGPTLAEEGWIVKGWWQ